MKYVLFIVYLVYFVSIITLSDLGNKFTLTDIAIGFNWILIKIIQGADSTQNSLSYINSLSEFFRFIGRLLILRYNGKLQ